ncbi:hypothetical protein fugu_012551 [Takifugu bimaculatus]|uniref:Thyroglobulin type-1 domain-containing protein n=2 Tax=Takifugu TaxID=31032 RepID=A0A5C6PG28_9TELE|nr:hypothetical protein fugu_012551 [Takifugu bimaculatus]TWW78345.1 hypothetical protein D4764_11G0004660 [Takifugu flavidus]
MDPETANQPLITGNAAVNEPPNGGRSTRAYKVAGITLLACVLIAGQVMTAYFLLAQKGEIKSLEEQGNKLKSVMTNGRSAASPSQMRIPANSIAGLYDVSLDKDTSSEEKENPATDCQLKALGLKSTGLPGFRPVCDERGLYQAEQCFKSQCWCVSPNDGQVISGSMRTGRASCTSAVASGKHAALS